MKKLAIGILNYNNKYEADRCNRLLKEMDISQDSVFNWDGVEQLKVRTEEYIAFWDVFDKWEMQKVEVCMFHMAENDADVIIHSYIQHVGLKSIQYKVPDSKQADMIQILYQGFPGISAMIFRREWLWNLLSGQQNIEIGSEEFYRLLFHMFTNNQHNIGFIASSLSEHWSYYGSRTPSVKQAKEDMIRYWNTIDIEAENKLLPMCYRYFADNYGEFSITEFLEGVSMNKEELAEVLRMHEENLTQQLQAVNRNIERKNDFYLFMCSWVELHQSGGNIADKLMQAGISTVAIYGAGKHGMMLYNELKSTKVKVDYWIDRNCKAETIEECPVISVDNKLPPVDAVIITPYREFQSIESSLKEKIKARMIPLDILVRR